MEGIYYSQLVREKFIDVELFRMKSVHDFDNDINEQVNSLMNRLDFFLRSSNKVIYFSLGEHSNSKQTKRGFLSFWIYDYVSNRNLG